MSTDAAYQDMFKTAEQCVRCRCGCCKDECPMYSEILEETISPKGRNQVIHAISTNELIPDDRAMRIAFSCLLCKRDELTCLAQLKNADATEAFRRYLIEKGIAPLPEHAMLAKSLENYGNPWKEPRLARRKWARELAEHRAVPGLTETLFYVGCTYSLDRSLQEAPKALARIMKRIGERFGLLLEDELCCGSTAKRIGQARLFEKLKSQNEGALRATGARRLVTACAGCYKTLKQDYGELSRDIEVLHSSEYLAELIKEGRLAPKRTRVTVTYHDPCHLGRHAGVFDAPREVLRSIPGLELKEMKTSRELSRCCGGGAGVKTAYPEVSQRAALRRLREAESTGAQILVTACPFCVQTLRGAAEASGSALEVVELEVFVERCS